MQTNNKLREALEKISLLSSAAPPHLKPIAVIVEIGKLADAALAEPVRNYEVGTVDEQTERKFEFCQKQGSCGNCPFNGGPLITPCVLAWAQMPYEEGDTK